MEYGDERTYRESDWAVRRWDWFNKGRIVEPKSFCQFWRTVVLYATVKWLFLLLTFPLRPTFYRAVAIGERIDRFGKRHEKGMTRLGRGFLVLYFLGIALIVLALIVSSWILSMAIFGLALIGAFVTWFCSKTGILGLLWQAAVAAKHGVCPPVRIVRKDQPETTS